MAQVGRTVFTSDKPELDIVYNCTHDSKQVMTIDAHNTRLVYLIVDQDIRPAWYCLLFVELLIAQFSLFPPHPKNSTQDTRRIQDDAMHSLHRVYIGPQSYSSFACSTFRG